MRNSRCSKSLRLPALWVGVVFCWGLLTACDADEPPAPGSDTVDVPACEGEVLTELEVERGKGDPKNTAASVEFDAVGAVCFEVVAGPDGAQAPASAVVEVDGHRVASPNDFNAAPKAFSRVLLGLNPGSHELHVAVASKPGSVLKVRVVDIDDIDEIVESGAPVSGEVGPDGGVVGGLDAAALVHVPPGALDQDTLIGAAALSPALLDAEVQPEDLTIIGGAELSPDGTTFATPALVIVPLFVRRPPGEMLTALTYDEEQQAWIRAEDPETGHHWGTVTDDGAHAAFYVTHFSGHAVALPEIADIDVVQIGVVNGVEHYCHPGSSFAVWDGPFVLTPGMNNEDFRRKIYEDVFETILLRPREGESVLLVAAERTLDAASAAAAAAGSGWDAATAFDEVQRFIRDVWGASIDAPDTFKHTTLLNVRKHFSDIGNMLEAFDLALEINDKKLEVFVVWALTAGAQETRIDALRSYLDQSGLDDDPAIKAAFETVAQEILARQELMKSSLAQALLQLADEQAEVTIEALVDKGVELFLPQLATNWLRSRGVITAGTAAKWLGWAGLILDTGFAVNTSHKRSSGLCALATLYNHGLHDADVEVDGVELTELRYIAFADFSHSMAEAVIGDEMGLTGPVIAGLVDIYSFGTLTRIRYFWMAQRKRADEAVAALSSLRYEFEAHPAHEYTRSHTDANFDFTCESNALIDASSCGSDYLGCYDGPAGSWRWTYSVANPDCTAVFPLLATTTGWQDVSAQIHTFCDQSTHVEYFVEDDYATNWVIRNHYSPTLQDASLWLGSFHFTAGQNYRVIIGDHGPNGYQVTPDWCQAAGGDHHINVNLEDIAFAAGEVPESSLVPEQRERVDIDGASVLAWPFETTAWVEVLGSDYHTCDDAFAKDMNTTLGSCDTEIDLGPMNVRAPISGTIRWVGESTDTGRGYQILIESDSHPGFFVSLAHLQWFNGEGMMGTHVSAGDVLPAAVGDSGTNCAHLHIVAWRGVLSDDARSRVLNGRTPSGYDCSTSAYAAPFDLNMDWR